MPMIRRRAIDEGLQFHREGRARDSWLGRKAERKRDESPKWATRNGASTDDAGPKRRTKVARPRSGDQVSTDGEENAAASSMQRARVEARVVLTGPRNEAFDSRDHQPSQQSRSRAAQLRDQETG
jgi:hypothetical protein